MLLMIVYLSPSTPNERSIPQDVVNESCSGPVAEVRSASCKTNIPYCLNLRLALPHRGWIIQRHLPIKENLQYFANYAADVTSLIAGQSQHLHITRST